MKTRTNQPIQLEEVGSVTTLPSQICDSLECGDIVVKKDSAGKHSYVVSYKKSDEMCLTYCDHSIVEEVYYEKGESGWTYIQTDVEKFEEHSKTYEVEYLDNIPTDVMDKVKIGDFISTTEGQCGIVIYEDENEKDIILFSQGYITFYIYMLDEEWSLDETLDYNYNKILYKYTIKIDGYKTYHTGHIQNGISGYTLVFDVLTFEPLSSSTLTFNQLKTLIGNSWIVANNSQADGFIMMRVADGGSTIGVGYDGDEFDGQDLDAIKNAGYLDVLASSVYGQ